MSVKYHISHIYLWGKGESENRAGKNSHFVMSFDVIPVK